MFEELSCGACGKAQMRLRGRKAEHGGHGTYSDIAAVCTGCGSVTHLVVPQPAVQLAWGRRAEGEKNDGVLCSMPWPRDGA